VLDFFLAHFENDMFGAIIGDEVFVPECVDQVARPAGKVVWIKESDSATKDRKADWTAARAFFFSAMRQRGKAPATESEFARRKASLEFGNRLRSWSRFTFCSRPASIT
jgi:hypothetical protein